MKTVGQLREFLKDLPDDMEVGGWDDFYERLECWGFSVETVIFSNTQKVKMVVFDIEETIRWEEPD